MNPAVRKAFPYIIAALALASLVWAISSSNLPEAEFTFNNGGEVKTVDPPKATGAPEGRIINALFEGLYRSYPVGIEFDDDGNVTKWPEPGADGNTPTEPQPALAESYKISPDGLTYEFKMRSGALWSNKSGTFTEPITANDFVWSWMRMLHPETASRYANQLTSYVVGALEYNSGVVKIGDRVEVELTADWRTQQQTFPRGPLKRGILTKFGFPPRPKIFDNKDATEKAKKDGRSGWKDQWVYVVEVKPENGGEVQWDAPGELKAFRKSPPDDEAMYSWRSEAGTASDLSPDEAPSLEELGNRQSHYKDEYRGEITAAMNVLYDFGSQVGIRASVDETSGDDTLVVELKNPTPFFIHLVAFYPLHPVNRRCIEEHGVPNWTKPENIVCSGPFHLEFRRIRDRTRLVRNPNYWNARVTKLKTIDALAVESETTGLNLYLDNRCEWQTTVPTSIVKEVQNRKDFHSAPSLATYFYRLNVNRPPLDDVHVRRALNMALDKKLICDQVTRAGQVPARSIVPPGLAGYTSPQCSAFDVDAARKELAKSKYAQSGEPLPTLELLYNNQGAHGVVAEVIQQQWKNNLNIDVKLANMEWGSFLDTVHQMDYTVARAGWIGDYPDPNTFLDMWVTDGEHNETGWSNKGYDGLIAAAMAETDGETRLKLLHDAEAILMDEQPIIPIYFYVSINLVRPSVSGFYSDIQDVHPLHLLRIDD